MKRYGIPVVVALLAILASQCLYVITETEQVVVTEFGKPLSTEKEAGINFKMPWHTTHYFDKRLIRWDGAKSEVPTKDKKFIEVDTTARWRIVDPLKFLESVRDVQGAQSRLDDILDSEVRDALTDNLLIEIVRSDRTGGIVDRIRTESARLEEQEVVVEEAQSGEDDLLYRIEMGREQIQEAITESARGPILEQYGIEVLDVRIKRLNYVEEVRQTIYKRMITERKKIAEKYRSQGQGQRARISGEMERRLREIKSSAEREARQNEGEADAKAAAVYARAYEVDPEFYSFYKTLQSYEIALKGRVRPVFSIDNEYFRYLQDRGQTSLTEGERQTRLKQVQQTLLDIEALGRQYSPSAEDKAGAGDSGAVKPEATPEATPKAPKPVPSPEEVAPKPTPSPAQPAPAPAQP